eukprot:1334327-Rhodomonas_salina.6
MADFGWISDAGAPPGARPPVMWKGAGGSGGQMLSGTKPAWTQVRCCVGTPRACCVLRVACC